MDPYLLVEVVRRSRGGRRWDRVTDRVVVPENWAVHIGRKDNGPTALGRKDNDPSYIVPTGAFTGRFGGELPIEQMFGDGRPVVEVDLVSDRPVQANHLRISYNSDTGHWTLKNLANGRLESQGGVTVDLQSWGLPNTRTPVVALSESAITHARMAILFPDPAPVAVLVTDINDALRHWDDHVTDRRGPRPDYKPYPKYNPPGRIPLEGEATLRHFATTFRSHLGFPVGHTIPDPPSWIELGRLACRHDRLEGALAESRGAAVRVGVNAAMRQLGARNPDVSLLTLVDRHSSLPFEIAYDLISNMYPNLPDVPSTFPQGLTDVRALAPAILAGEFPIAKVLYQNGRDLTAVFQ